MQIKITVSVGLEHLQRDASWPPLSPQSSSVITPSAFRVRAQRSENKRGPVCVYSTSTKSKRAGGAFEVDGVGAAGVYHWLARAAPSQERNPRTQPSLYSANKIRLILSPSFWRLYCKRLSTDSNSCSQSPACWRWNCNHHLWVLPVWGLGKVAEGGLGCDGGWDRVVTNKVHYGCIKSYLIMGPLFMQIQVEKSIYRDWSCFWVIRMVNCCDTAVFYRVEEEFCSGHEADNVRLR